MKKISTFLLLLAGLNCGSAIAQDQVAVDSAAWQAITNLQQQVNYQKPGESHFMVVGLTTFGFVNSQTTSSGVTTKTNSFADADHYEFSPMFLWRQGKKVLLEFEPSYTGGTLGVNWADISYFVAPGLIVRAGYFVLPFGIYNKRLAAGWIGKMASDPMGTSTMPPSSDFGVELEGGFPLGNMKWSYDVSLTNGMQLLPDGTLQNAGITDNNTNKTLAGRLALLPLSNSSLEVGVSGLFGNVGDANSIYKNATTNMYALDLSYVKKIKKMLLNVKAQYNMINVSNQNYTNPTDSTQVYSFTNNTTTSFFQASMRPAYVSNKILKNFEIAFRYANLNTPKSSAWQQNASETDIGLDYWLSWRSVLKLTYEMINTSTDANSNIGIAGGSATTNKIYVQFSTQL